MSWTDWLDNRIRTICSATCAATRAPKGVRLENRALTLPASKDLVIPFPNPPTWHDGGYINTANPTRVTVPTGLDGPHFVRAEVHWALNTGNSFSTAFRDGTCFVSKIILNGNASANPLDSLSVAAPVATGYTTQQSIIWEPDLAAGDFLELHVAWHDAVAQAGILPSQLMIEAWLTVRRL